ncbi:hypothetical protein HPB51_005893 [Rhipicephalus microplus]|uniref:Uncharacterized protein n=1 Tax=Rhipicephalus microplus TaxID=6941 RepID=A0A9J6D3Q4_RHIMP|nr:hypothetical protein HPB51_005893 [Rhipicephalus microplus]
MKSRSRTASSQWPAGLNRPTSPSVRSPKAPSNVVVTTPLVPAQVVIQGGWTPAGLAVNVGRHHSRSIASSHDSEVNILPNDTRLPATGSKSVDNRFAVLPSLPERSKSREFDGSLHAVLRKSVSVVSAKSTGKSAGSSIWSKSAYTEMLPVAHCSKSVAVKRSGVIVAFSASPSNASVFERHGKLAALLADSPTQQRTAFRRSDSVAGSGNQPDMKKGTAQGLLGHPVSKILMSAEHLKLPKKRSASSQRSRSGILKTTRTSQGGSFVPSPHAEEVTIRSVEICPIVQTRVAFNRADRLAIARGTRSAPNNDESALAQSSRQQVAGLKKTSKTEISKSGESGRIQIIGSPKSCREAFTKPTLLQPPSHGVSLIDDHHGFKDFASDNTTAGTFLSLHSQPVFASATLPHKIAEMRSGAPSESIHEPIEKTAPLVSPQASKSLSASDSTKLSLIKAAPTVDKAEQAVVGVKSAATSPFTGGKVMKSATTSPFSQWGIAPTSAGTFPRAEANALLPHTGQGLSEPAKTSTASHHESAQLSTSVVPPRRAIIRPNSSEFASCECLDATMPNLFPAPGSPRPTAGLLDPNKSPRSGAHSTSELTKSIIGNEASTRKNLIQPAPTITETNSKKGLIRPDIKPASMREKSPRLSVTLSPHETNASSLRTTGNISVTTGTTAANFSDSSPVNRSHPGSPVYMTSVLLGSTSTESWSPLVASSVPDSNKSPRETTGTAPQAPQDTIFSELWTPRAASGVLDPTKSHRSSPGTTVVLRTTQAVSGILDSTKSPIRSPGIIPEASVTGLFPEQWTPQTASGFLDPTKSPRISSGTSDEASRCRLYLEPWTPLAASGFLDTTKSLRGSAGTSLGPKTPQAASGLLDTRHPVTVFDPSQSETSMAPATVMSPGESSFRSPGRARNALSTGSPSKNSSDLASPGEIRKLLEAKGDPAHLSPQHRSSPTDMPSSTQPLARPISPSEERHKQAETKERTVRSEGSRPSLTEKSLEMKLPSSPFASSQTAASEKKPHRGSSLHVLTSTGDKPTCMSSGRGPTELDKTESATFIVHGTQAKTGIERQELSVHSSPELVPAGSTTGQFETSSGLFPDVVEKSRITTPEIDTKGSPQRNKGQSSHKGHNALKGSKFSIEDLSFSEHIAHAISESSADFADIPLQVNMTIDLVPPKSPMSPPRAIMSPVHIEKKMIVESYKDGHVEVKVPPVYIDVSDGKRAVDEALNVSVSVDVGKKVPQDHKSPEEGSQNPAESHRPEQSQHPEESHHDEKQ